MLSDRLGPLGVVVTGVAVTAAAMAITLVFLAFAAGRIDGDMLTLRGWLPAPFYGAMTVSVLMTRRRIRHRDGGRQLALDQRLRRALRSGTLPADADGLIAPLTARFEGASFGAVAAPVATAAVAGYAVYRAVTATDGAFGVLAWVVAILLVGVGAAWLVGGLRARRAAGALLIQWSDRESARQEAAA
ncbi:hypothetical protein [Tersicoccus sp. Bi-70]|uniref:hypothetical protein n=1 Tax=Tersicoccus sp. Bi-70 TaxID=1897634 RepID=UPI00117CAC70|nr:hypothetical protein [Tersicoccus sp. Bi-70]